MNIRHNIQSKKKKGGGGGWWYDANERHFRLVKLKPQVAHD